MTSSTSSTSAARRCWWRPSSPRWTSTRTPNWASTGRPSPTARPPRPAPSSARSAAPASSTWPARCRIRARVSTTLLQGTTVAVGRIMGSGVNFAAMIRAIRGDTNTNVIATPSAVTMDNQEAELKVAQEVPFVTGQYTNSNAQHRHRLGEPLPDHPARGSGHDPQGHPDDLPGGLGGDDEDLDRKLEHRPEARRGGRPGHQQAHHHHQRAHRGRRRGGARRPDRGQQRQGRAARALPGQHPAASACCSRRATRPRPRTT